MGKLTGGLQIFQYEGYFVYFTNSCSLKKKQFSN